MSSATIPDCVLCPLCNRDAEVLYDPFADGRLSGGRFLEHHEIPVLSSAPAALFGFVRCPLSGAAIFSRVEAP